VTRRFKTWTDLLVAGAEHLPEAVGFGVLREGAEPDEICRGALVDRAQRVSGGLRDLGLRKGSVVVLVGEPSVAWIVTFAAVLLGGGMPMPLNPRSSSAEFERVMAVSGAKLAVVSTAGIPADSDGKDKARKVITFERAGGACPSVEEMYDLDPAAPVLCGETDPAVVMQTSGTTGNPKCVVHTHRSHLEFVERWTELTMTPEDRILSFLPMNHQAGLFMGWTSAYSLGTPFYHLSRFSLSGFWGAVRTYGITWTTLMDPVPTWLLDAAPSSDDRNHSLRFVASSKRPHQVAEMEKRFGIRPMRPYGSTESTFIAMSVDLDRPEVRDLTPEQAAACAGPPVRDCGFRIIEPDGSEAPTEVTGALEVFSPSLFSCYLNDPEATERAFSEDGWFKTGDRAYVNEHGELFFVERAGNSIRRSGEFISAAEVEETLLRHPEIGDACVVAVPDDLRGQEVRACIVRVPGSTVAAQEIFDHCLASLTKFKVPRYIDFWESLPRTSTLKVSRGALDSDPAAWVDRFK